MDLPSSVIIDVLTFLLPGLVTAAVIANLTPVPKQAPFERTIQALIFTIILQALSVGTMTALLWIGSKTGAIGFWTENTGLVWSLLLALSLGLLLAHFANTDKLHSVLRQLHITCQTSFPSEWFGALMRNKGYVVLHLDGERRLYGWAEEWPSSPERGHFVIMQGEWLTETSRIPLSGVEKILIKARDVEMVELMIRTDPEPNGEANGRT